MILTQCSIGRPARASSPIGGSRMTAAAPVDPWPAESPHREEPGGAG